MDGHTGESLLHREFGETLVRHLRMPYLLKHFEARHVWAAFVFINSFITIAILSAFAYVFNLPFIFPSLGPTAIMFFLTPRAIAARPRNVIGGHAIGIVCGYLGLVMTGLAAAPSILTDGVTLPRIFAASIALALTGAVMVIAKTPHSPAGATTLIIALGFITQPTSLAIIEVAVCLLVLQAVAIDAITGVEG